MSIIGIDIGSSTIKIIEYKDKEIVSKGIFESKDYSKVIDEYISEIGRASCRERV